MCAKKNIKEVVGYNIKMLRLKEGMRLATVSGILGISSPALSKIENGITDIHLSRLWQIASFFGVRPTALLCSKPLKLPEDVKDKTKLKAQFQAYDQEILELNRKLIELYEEIHRIRLGKRI